MVDTKLLDNLSILAKQLNSESDTLNDSIAQINKKLRAMNIGLEFYVEMRHTEPPLDSNGAERWKVDYLGFDKLDDVWQLSVKSETREGWWDPNDEEVKHHVIELSYMPLLKASRELRLLAAEELDSFLDQLTSHVERKLKAAHSAKKKAGLK